MVNSSGQFLRRRVIKDALPSLVSYLVKQQTVSARAGTVYSHTLGFKYESAILNVIGRICYDLEITDIECNKVISAILPYLSHAQPPRLQQVLFLNFYSPYLTVKPMRFTESCGHADLPVARLVRKAYVTKCTTKQ